MRKILAALALLFLPALACAQWAPLLLNDGLHLSMSNTQPIPAGKANLTTPGNVGFARGPSGTAGITAHTDWVWNNGAIAFPTIGGLWGGTAIDAGVGFSRTWTSGTKDVPQIALGSLAVNDGSAGDSVSNMTVCYAKTATGSCFGSNIIAFSDNSLTNVKLVGLEIDIQPGARTTLTGASNGLILNTWTSANPASALSINSASSGTWSMGIQCAPASIVGPCLQVPNGSAKGVRYLGTDGVHNGSISMSSDSLTVQEGRTGLAIKSQDLSTNHLNVTSTSAQFGLPVQLPGYTVATLPTCNLGLRGGMAYVTDASRPTYNGALTGGSTTSVPVFCNGSAWTAH